MLTESLQATQLIMNRFDLSSKFAWELLTARPALDITLAVDDSDGPRGRVVGVAVGLLHSHGYMPEMSALAYVDKILSYEDKAVICASSRAIKVRTYPFVTRARPPLSYLPLAKSTIFTCLQL